MAHPVALIGAGGSLASPKNKPKLTDAALALYEAKATPGGARTGAALGRIDFQFRPKEISIQKSAKWERKPARGSKGAGPPEFSGAEPCKMTFELFFDATGAPDGSVVEAVEQLFACCTPTDASLADKKGSPPLVVLRWGSVSSFAAFVTSVQAKYTLFRSDGTPIRATCAITLEEMPGNPPKQNPTSGSLANASRHTLVAGETLAAVAWTEYGDAALWRPLARVNGIDDPLRVAVGSTLLVPSVEDLTAAAG